MAILNSLYKRPDSDQFVMYKAKFNKCGEQRVISLMTGCAYRRLSVVQGICSASSMRTTKIVKKVALTIAVLKVADIRFCLRLSARLGCSTRQLSNQRAGTDISVILQIPHLRVQNQGFFTVLVVFLAAGTTTDDLGRLVAQIAVESKKDCHVIDWQKFSVSS